MGHNSSALGGANSGSDDVENGIIRGFVMVANGSKLSGVNVEIDGAQKRAQITNENGYFNFLGVEAGEYMITSSKVNYIDRVQAHRVEGGVRNPAHVFITMHEQQ